VKVLFVDDEANVLRGLQRMLRRLSNEWNMQFVASGREALELLAKEPFDVVITDVRMPVMDGVQLLTLMQQRHPEVVRIILSGHAGEDSMLRAVGPAHQCLSKPCDSDKIQATVRRAVALRNAMSNDKLQRVVASMPRLPSLPALYQRIMQELRSADPSIANVAKIVGQDMAMSAKVLQLVNSSFFGLSTEVADPARAVVHLGLDTVRALALYSGVFEQVDARSAALIGDLWDHSTRIGCIARSIAIAEHAPKDQCDSAFQAGFLHDVGRLVVVANAPEVAARSGPRSGEGPTSLQIEREVLGVTHAEVGGYLLGIWGLPDAVVEAVMFHHGDQLAVVDGFSVLAAVQFAEAMEHAGHEAQDAGLERVLAARPHLAALGSRLEQWWQAIPTLHTEECDR